ncbi:MAG: PIG-L deacetylase family protein [Acidimicrobiia bacterium]
MNDAPVQSLSGLAPPRSALAIGAHPDDIEFGAGATLAKWAAGGTIVHHLVCTDGSKGSWDPGDDIGALVALRQDEQRAAAAALGATGEVVFLGYTDGELGSGLDERAAAARVIRTLEPEVVLGHDPWRRYRLHPDHRHAGHLAVEGIVAARDPHFFPDQGLGPWRPSALLLFEADEADHVEDVTGFAEHKLAALYRHQSQLRSTMHVEVGSPDEDAQRDRFRAKVLDRLAVAATGTGFTYGEAFKLIDDL